MMPITEDLLIKFGAEFVNYKKNEPLFSENLPVCKYFQICRGSVKVINYRDGKEIIHAVLSKGDAVGETFLFCTEAYSVGAIALEDSIVLQLDRSVFHELIKRYPDLLIALYKQSARRLHYACLLHSICFSNPRSRILTIINDLKAGQQGNKEYSFIVPYTRQQIASMTCLRVETVVRTIKLMEKESTLKIMNGKLLY
ncbi:Crp/Fnr family transcriptional regulator [Chryseobacterium sp. DT-3]|uniref:Crp/Fnr family transcriptional regulator n=1 Tax=Chryseobacterium sp. DT-3 TaxID=3396164 RepID=UPI003F19AA63